MRWPWGARAKLREAKALEADVDLAMTALPAVTAWARIIAPSAGTTAATDALASTLHRGATAHQAERAATAALSRAACKDSSSVPAGAALNVGAALGARAGAHPDAVFESRTNPAATLYQPDHVRLEKALEGLSALQKVCAASYFIDGDDAGVIAHRLHLRRADVVQALREALAVLAPAVGETDLPDVSADISRVTVEVK